MVLLYWQLSVDIEVQECSLNLCNSENNFWDGNSCSPSLFPLLVNVARFLKEVETTLICFLKYLSAIDGALDH